MRCSAIKANGERCQGIAKAGNDFCPAHDPARAEARRRAASKAGRSRQGGEIYQIKGELKKLAEDVLAKRVNTGVGSVANQAYGTHLKCLEVEIRERDVAVRETELSAIKIPEFQRLETELGELREMLAEREAREKRGRPWAG